METTALRLGGMAPWSILLAGIALFVVALRYARRPEPRTMTMLGAISALTALCGFSGFISDAMAQMGNAPHPLAAVGASLSNILFAGGWLLAAAFVVAVGGLRIACRDEALLKARALGQQHTDGMTAAVVTQDHRASRQPNLQPATEDVAAELWQGSRIEATQAAEETHGLAAG